MKIIKPLSLLLFMANCAVSSVVQAAENKTEYCQESQAGQADCTLVILSEKNNQRAVINAKRAAQAFSPFSTFKIPNSIIGLEQGLIKNAQQVLTFDKKKYPPQSWWPSVWKMPEYTLSTAFKFSMVAVYRQLATDIGAKPMQVALGDFAYGNQDISSGLDSFWLNGSMKISADQQISFLRKLYHNEFGLKRSSLATIKAVMIADKGENYTMYAKTGAGKVDDKSMLGWYVGFVENKQGVHYFAFNFNRATYSAMKKSRTQIVVNHLKKSGII